MPLIKQTLDEWLDQVDYREINSINYRPSEFALNYMNFIKLVNGVQGESHATPPVHLKMLDKVTSSASDYIANLCFRGAAKALSLDTEILTTSGWSTIADLKVGEFVYGEDGKPTRVLAKSEVFNKPMYRISLSDGRSLDVSEDHINVIIHKRVRRINGQCKTVYERREVTTKELLDIPLGSTRTQTEKNPRGWENAVWIPNGEAVVLPTADLPIDPYVLGLILGDGSVSKETGHARLHCHIDDLPSYTPYFDSGVVCLDKRNPNVATVGIKGSGVHLKDMGLNVHGDFKFIPTEYLHGSIEQRLALLQGLMDTDGTVNKATPSFASNSIELAKGVQYLVYSLGGIATPTHSTTASGKTGYRVSINLGMPVFRLQRKLDKVTARVLGKVSVLSVEPIATCESQCIAVDNESKTFLAGEFVVTHNTTLFMEYFVLYTALFGWIPGVGDVTGMIYVSDSMDNGVKSARKNIEFRYQNSEFLQKWLPKATFTDNYLEFINADGHRLGVKMFGAKALALDTILFTPTGTTTIGSCQVGDVIMGADGKPTTITRKSEIFDKPMYSLNLVDGRSLRVSEDHLNQVWKKTFHSNLAIPPSWEELTLDTNELLALPLHRLEKRGDSTHKRPLLWIENCKSVEFKEVDLPVDPYTVGLLLGDGSMAIKTTGQFSVRLVAHKDDWVTYRQLIPYELGKAQVDKRNTNVVTHTLLGMKASIAQLGMNCHGNLKEIPYSYFFGSVNQRLALLQGLMDTDGTCSKEGRTTFTSNSEKLVAGVVSLVRSLGGTATMRRSTDKAWQAHLKLNMPMFRLERKASRQKTHRHMMVAIESITRIANEPSQCIAVDNGERQFIADDFVRTHNTGLRGTKIFGKRPTVCVLDDLVSDDDSKSKVAMEAIKDTVYKGVNHALDPTCRKVIFNGTPFNMEDILIEAVESGAWDVNVWPVCERFPCSREEFVGAWEDRFSYDYIQSQYDLAEKTGKLAGFYQELMLRITSSDERLVQDAEIKWYSRKELLRNKGHFNFYITTDFATSSKQTADFSVISVWAYNSNGDWFWVDGFCERTTIDVSFDALFRLVQEYKPQQVGVEVTGQQQAYIKLLQKEMMVKNVWFNFASSEKSGEPGIRPVVDKLQRFNVVVPWFKAGKFYWPEEMKHTKILGMFHQQIKLTTRSGIKGKDDCLDTISMLGYFNPWKPSDAAKLTSAGEVDVYDDMDDNDDGGGGGLSSYIV